jgi:dynein heavy chain
LDLVREGLNGVAHKIIVALITVDVHNRDIIENLVNLDVSQHTDFNWQ